MVGQQRRKLRRSSMSAATDSISDVCCRVARDRNRSTDQWGGSYLIRKQCPLAPDGFRQVTERINPHLRQGYENADTGCNVCDDRVFVRRLYLDLAGRIPRQSEVDLFMEDCSESDGGRARLIKRLLGSEEHVTHWADMFDTLLMGRAADSKYTQRRDSRWRAFLENSIRANQPWNEFIEDILLARPADDKKRGGNWFLFERNDDHQKIAEAVAPAIFGIRIECAQCHDHMLVDEIKQAHYWGLVAFFNRGKNVNGKGGPQIQEAQSVGF